MAKSSDSYKGKAKQGPPQKKDKGGAPVKPVAKGAGTSPAVEAARRLMQGGKMDTSK